MKMSVYKVIELVGTSEVSWEEAAKEVLATAKKSLRNLRVAEVSELDVKLDEDKVVYRAKMRVS
ncbi:MAG: dodecin domain-containing protein, partial [Deltaproteobacteria bacterium]|nr:dodecin domain-containing protein [Deltaproteobacteria bacterium]